MAKPEHVAILKEGVAAWNRWREQNPDIGPVLADLADGDLPNAVLDEANLDGADLQRSNLRGASLRKANLKDARFQNADLREANLEGAILGRTAFGNADLRKARLRGTDLRGASLVEANLGGTDLRGADLRGIGFKGTNLSDTVLRESDLQDASLEESQGLRARQLAGANLTGATLPEGVRQLEALDSVKELSQNARKLFISMLAACVYCWLTIATTTDVRLITNTASSPLPIIQTPIPIVGFYVAAPLLLLCLYFYFHFYMQRLWEALADLPAFFPDGAPLDSKAYPWLLNGLVRSYFPLLKKDRPALSCLQVFLATLLAWWLLPLTLFYFWWRYLFRHDLNFMLLHIFLFVLSSGAAFALRRLAAATLRGKERKPFVWKRVLGDRRTYQRVAGIAVMAAIFLGLWQVSRTAIFGVRSIGFFRALIVEAFAADFVEADVSIKPEGWTGRPTEEEIQIPMVKGARLRGANLRYVRARGAFLVKADFQEADLQGASFLGADIRKADFGPYPDRPRFQGAIFSAPVVPLNEELIGALTIQGANLQDADLGFANLQETDFFGSNFEGANLAGADLQGADLHSVKGLTSEQLKAAWHWWLAYYSDDFLEQLGFPPDHNDKVREALKLLDAGKEEESQKLSEEIRRAVVSDE